METVFSVLESVTLFAGLIYVFLQVKQNIWMWPVDILCCAAAIAVFCHQQLWASMALNAYYLVMGFIGLATWKKDAGHFEEQFIRLRRLSVKTAVVSLAGFLVSGVILHYVLSLTGDSSPVMDAFIGASGVVGTVWLVRSYPQNWYIWIVSDIFSTILCFSQGLHLMAVLYLVYTAVAVVGCREWKSKGRYIG